MPAFHLSISKKGKNVADAVLKWEITTLQFPYSKSVFFLKHDTELKSISEIQCVLILNTGFSLFLSTSLISIRSRKGVDGPIIFVALKHLLLLKKT